MAILPLPVEPSLVEEMLLERGIVVSYETIRQRCTRGRKFGPKYARQLRRKQPNRSDIWHLDDSVARQDFAEQKPERVVIGINGKKHWRWRAVDQAKAQSLCAG